MGDLTGEQDENVKDKMKDTLDDIGKFVDSVNENINGLTTTNEILEFRTKVEELWKDMEKEVSNLKSDARRETAFVEKMFSDLEEQLSNLSVQKELIDQRKDRKKVQDNLDYFINEVYEDNQVKNRDRRGRLEDKMHPLSEIDVTKLQENNDNFLPIINSIIMYFNHTSFY